jgi:glucose-1-phosphate thymidylyltransferase
VSTIKCIIAAGGLGTRLQGFRDNQSTKILLKVNSKPMIIQQLEQLISWGLNNFVIITNPSFDKLIKEETSQIREKYNIDYAIQPEQLGISHALKQASSYVNDDDQVIFVLGDNFFGNNPLVNIDFDELLSTNKNSIIFTKEVTNPEEFGVAVIDSSSKVIQIEEKPQNPKSNNAVVGLYVFDSTCMKKIDELKPSTRGEYEITDLINLYINEGTCSSINLDTWWIDAGTPERIIDLEEKLT